MLIHRPLFLAALAVTATLGSQTLRANEGTDKIDKILLLPVFLGGELDKSKPDVDGSKMKLPKQT